MVAQLIDGKALAARVRAQVAEQASRLQQEGHPPGLAVLLVGDDPASSIYVRNKARACAEAGIHSIVRDLPTTTTQEQLLREIGALNADASVDGILVQLPLPPQIDAGRVLAAIDPAKDVDGFHAVNAGALLNGQPGLRPCTPSGCMVMLESIGWGNLRGKQAVVLGRSNIVGKPVALMLLAAGATVTICHSGTPDLAAQARRADVLVSAVGRPGLVTADMVKPGAAVLDVGINRTPAGKLCGDVDFESVRAVAGYLTPVPGGVGPMTIAMLLSNTVQAARQRRA